MNTQNKQFGTPKNEIPPLAIVGVVVVFFLTGLFLLNATGNPAAEAKRTQVVYLEEQIKAAQVAYESSSQEAVRSQTAYCENWVALATLKSNLATALHMPVDPNWSTANINCAELTVPSSF